MEAAWRATPVRAAGRLEGGGAIQKGKDTGMEAPSAFSQDGETALRLGPLRRERARAEEAGPGQPGRGRDLGPDSKWRGSALKGEREEQKLTHMFRPARDSRAESSGPRRGLRASPPVVAAAV